MWGLTLCSGAPRGEMVPMLESSCFSVSSRSAWLPRSHINGVSGLLKPTVRGQVGVHGRILFNLLLHQAAKTGSARAVDLVLVLALQLVRRVAEHSAGLVLGNLGRLGHGKTRVKHVLVVLDDGGVAAVLVIESVLSVAEQVTLVTHRRHVRGPAVRLRSLVVLAQVRVESALSMGRSVVGAQTTRRVRDVRVAATSIVDIDDRLGVNVGQVVLGALLKERKGA